SQTGPKGDTGDPGPSGISHAYHDEQPGSVVPEGGFTALAGVGLEPGYYVVSAKTVLVGDESPGNLVICYIADPAFLFLTADGTSVAARPGSFISLQSIVHLTGPLTVALVCQTTVPGGFVVNHSQLTAIAVDAVN